MSKLLRALKRRLKLYLAPRPSREVIAARYLRGAGLEIGALHNPLRVPADIRVKYVDRMSVSQLRQHYPELQAMNLVPVDVIDDGQLLRTVPDSSQDFIIANHFIEHCEDPIRALMNHFRVLKVGGILYLAVPDRRFTFDKDRPATTLAHLHEDFERGPQHSRELHFEEWVRVVNKIAGDAQIQAQLQTLMAMDYSIHFHVWTALEFLEFLLSLRSQLNFELETALTEPERGEFVVVLRKTE